jgi:hypothetical protein
MVDARTCGALDKEPINSLAETLIDGAGAFPTISNSDDDAAGSLEVIIIAW